MRFYLHGFNFCTGSQHTPVSINKLFADATERVNQLQIRVNQRKETLLDLSKESDTVLAQLETETENMLKLLKETKDKQVRLKLPIESVSQFNCECKNRSVWLMTTYRGMYAAIKIG